jgi:hypothetical protein
LRRHWLGADSLRSDNSAGLCPAAALRRHWLGADPLRSDNSAGLGPEGPQRYGNTK